MRFHYLSWITSRNTPVREPESTSWQNKKNDRNFDPVFSCSSRGFFDNNDLLHKQSMAILHANQTHNVLAFLDGMPCDGKRIPMGPELSPTHLNLYNEIIESWNLPWDFWKSSIWVLANQGFLDWDFGETWWYLSMISAGTPEHLEIWTSFEPPTSWHGSEGGRT